MIDPFSGLIAKCILLVGLILMFGIGLAKTIMIVRSLL